MAISFTSLTGGTDSNLSSVNTASISPTTGRMVYVAVNSFAYAGAPIPTLSGLSQTWTQIYTSQYYSTLGRITVFRGLMSSPGTGALTISFGAAVQVSIGHSVVQGNDEVDSSGTNGANSVVQIVSAWGASNTPAVALSAFSQPQNAALVFCSTLATDGSFQYTGYPTEPGAGLTELVDGAAKEGNSVFYGTNVSSISLDVSSKNFWTICALEILTTEVGAPPDDGGDFPDYSTFTQTSLTPSATSHAINMPSSLVSGDLIIAFLWGLGTQTISNGIWTQLDQKTITATTSRRYAVFVKVSTGTEGATQSFTTSSATQLTGISTKISNWYGTIADGLAFIMSNVATAIPNTANLTPSWGSQNNLWITAYGGSITDPAAAPTNYSDYSNDGGTFVNHGAFRKLNAASEDPGAFTSVVSQQYVGITIAVRPAIVLTTPFISDVTPDSVEDGDVITITGFDFFETKDDGKVYLASTNNSLTADLVELTTTAWSDTSITAVIDKGTLSYGIRYVFVQNSDGPFSGPIPVTLLEPPPADVLPPPAYAEMSIILYDSSGNTVGGIVDIEEASITEGVNNIGTATISVPRKAFGTDSAILKREFGIWRQGEGEIFRGFISDKKKTINRDGSNMIRLDCFGLGYELQKKQSWRGFRFEQVSFQDALDTILEDTDWTSESVGDFVEITKMFDNMTILACIDELAKIGNAFWRIDPVSRHIEIRQVPSESGIVIANVEQGDANSRIGIIESLDDFSEDGSAIVNRLVVESKADTDAILTLRASDRTEPYEIKSLLAALPSLSSLKVGYGATDGDDEIINLVNQSLGENRYYNLFLEQVRADGLITKNIRGGSVGGRPLRNTIFGAGVIDGSIGYRLYTFDSANPPRGDLGLGLNIIDSTVAADLVGVGFVFKDVEFTYMAIYGTQRDTTSSTGDAQGYPTTPGEDLQYSILIRQTDAPATPGPNQTLIFDSTTVGGRVFVSVQEGNTVGATSSWTLSSPGDVWFHHIITAFAKKIYYIEDETSIASYGVHEKVIQLGTFLKLAEDKVTDIANAMYDWSVDYILKNKDAQLTYDFSVSWIPRGPLDWNVGSYLHPIYRDEEENIDDDTLICIERTQNFTREGIRSWKISVSNKTQFRQDEQGEWLLEQLKYQIAAIQINQT